MKKIYLFSVLILFASKLLIGQDTLVSEQRIKGSGLYYFGQGIESDKQAAKDEARHDLISMITTDIGVDGKLDLNSDILADGISYIYFPRGDKTRAVAFILKTRVNDIVTGAKLNVNRIYYKDKTDVSSENQSKSEVVVGDQTGLTEPVVLGNP